MGLYMTPSLHWCRFYFNIQKFNLNMKIKYALYPTLQRKNLNWLFTSRIFHLSIKKYAGNVT